MLLIMIKIILHKIKNNKHKLEVDDFEMYEIK